MEDNYTAPMPEEEEVKSGIDREAPEVDKARRRNVSFWLDEVGRGKMHAASVFKKMREDMDFVAGKQWANDPDSERYSANIVQRHVHQKVSTLYSKNPTAKARRRKRIENLVWDGTVSGYQQAMQAVTMNPLDMNALAVLQDFQNTDEQRKQLGRVSDTLELLYDHQMDNAEPSFKQQMKQLVRRTVITGVGYVKVGFDRVYEARPEDEARLRDATERLNVLTRLMADETDKVTDEADRERDQLRLLINDLQSQPEQITREGLVFDFPPSTSIIVDKRCRQLKGFIGASWVAQEFLLTNDQVKEIYGKDLKKGQYQGYDETGERLKESQPVDDEGLDGNASPLCCVYEIYSKRDRLLYVVVDGYHDFLKEPATPQPSLERFYPFFVLTFNQVENEKAIYPQSDCRLLRPLQLEFNRCRDALREHRYANRPKTFIGTGRMDEADRKKLQFHEANAVLEVNLLNNAEKINDVLQPWMGPPIQPDLYNVEPIIQDVLLVVGNSETSMGNATSDATATGESIAASARMTSTSSNIDDLDDLLSEMANAGGQVLLTEMDAATVKAIVGPGAAWPELTRQEAADQIYLEIEAGSSGRPNKAAEISNAERLMPWLVQMPGLNPEKILRELIKRWDDKAELSDFILAGAPSITAMNNQTQVGTGDPETDPNQQGSKGGNKTPQPNEPNGPVPQPAQMPMPGAM